MQEAFIHYVWLTGSFHAQDLKTTNGESIEIIRRGFAHTDAGPDFSNARIRIAGQLWGGHVEIHVYSSDWYAHKHEGDPAYDTTILHVCYHHDSDVVRTDGSKIPCLELKHLIFPGIQSTYEVLQQSLSEIPCSGMIDDVDQMVKSATLQRMALERLEEKSAEILDVAKGLSFDWNEVFYRSLSATYGLHINKEPFMHLAKVLPFKLVSRYAGQPEMLEALLFGAAGFLAESGGVDAYQRKLADHFKFLKHKHDIEPIPVHLWKFLRLRPSNFPTIRLAQFSALLNRYGGDVWFEHIKHARNLNVLRAIFRVEVSSYWQTHYRFGKQTSAEAVSKIPGIQTLDLIAINVALPVRFSYQRWMGNEVGAEEALSLFEEISAENNKAVRQMAGHGFEVKNALHSQGCIHLSRNYCNFKRCLQCPIGHSILNRSKYERKSPSNLEVPH